MLIVFSFHRKSFKLILIDELFPEVVLSQHERRATTSEVNAEQGRQTTA
jgi:hypothetical protein